MHGPTDLIQFSLFFRALARRWPRGLRPGVHHALRAPECKSAGRWGRAEDQECEAFWPITHPTLPERCATDYFQIEGGAGTQQGQWFRGFSAISSRRASCCQASLMARPSSPAPSPYELGVVIGEHGDGHQLFGLPEPPPPHGNARRQRIVVGSGRQSDAAPRCSASVGGGRSHLSRHFATGQACVEAFPMMVGRERTGEDVVGSTIGSMWTGRRPVRDPPAGRRAGAPWTEFPNVDCRVLPGFMPSVQGTLCVAPGQTGRSLNPRDIRAIRPVKGRGLA